jgi:hypothetical protein
MAVYSQNHTELKNHSVGEMQSYWLLKKVVRTVTTGLSAVNTVYSPADTQAVQMR